MGRPKKDRSQQIMQSFETSKPLRERLIALAARKNKTVSAVIREILESYFENRENI